MANAPKTKRGVNPLIASFRRQMIDEIIAEERQREQSKIMISEATVSMMYGQTRVEVKIIASDSEGMTANEIKHDVDYLIEHGFTPATYQRREQGDKLEKTGTVTSVKPVEGTKMFEVVGTLDDGAGEFKWREFNASSFRVKDRFKVVKNDRGFMTGQLIIDDGEQMVMPL